MWPIPVHELVDQFQGMRWHRSFGRVSKVVGMTIESVGPSAKLGDVCVIHASTNSGCLAEVVGFKGENLVLMPLGELSSVSQDSEVMVQHGGLSVQCGWELLGRVLDGLGNPIDGKGSLIHGGHRPLDAAPPHPLQRPPIHKPLQTGVRAMDGLLTVGEGQRIGIFAGSGVGKSTLLSMIARNTSADVNVIALVGERGREVREFLERDLGEAGLKNSVVIVATSDQPALIRLKAAFAATAIAEFFRDEGCSVTLMMDSVTRFAMAQREIGLAVGEPPTSRGYTPSVFALLPKLLERAGTSEQGSITAFYTVLVDGDDLNDPIADAVRGILDGHIVLSRDIANAGRFPALDVLGSISRLFTVLATPQHKLAANQVRSWMQRYRQVEDLLRIGAYQPGADAETDIAVSRYPKILEYLQQDSAEVISLEESLASLYALSGVNEA